MKAFVLTLCVSIISLTSYAHAPDEAFFDVFKSDNTLVIKAEFPWTLRNTLLAANPSLKEAKTIQEMEDGLLVYLQQNIQVTDIHDQVIPLKKIKALPNHNGHTHGMLYLLIFDRYSKVKSISNTCMFDSYQDQQNFHTIDDSLKFTTNQSSPAFEIVTTTSRDSSIWILFLVLGISISGIITYLFVK